MPNIIFHTLFADEIIKDEPEWLQKRIALFEAGSNGPDPLFFQGLSPKRRFHTSKLAKYGSQLHAAHTNEFFLSALSSIHQQKDEELKKDMIAYTAGFLCHWALDSVMHPYVFYRTGPCKGESAAAHHRLESLMDAIMLKVWRKQTIQDYDASKAADLSKEDMCAVCRILVPAINTIFKEDIKPHMIVDTFEDWHFMQKLFRDPSRNKFKALRLIETAAGKKNRLSGFIVPPEPIDDYDVMNLLHKTWVHPCSLYESTQSVFDLTEEAENKARAILKLFFAACENKKDVPAFIDALDNENYDMNKGRKEDMKIFRPEHFH